VDNINLLKLKYFLKKYKFELITFLSTITILWFSEFINIFDEKPNVLSILKGVIVLTSTLIIIFLRSREKQFYFISLSKRAEKDDWIGKGNFEFDRKYECFIITNASSGFIYSKCLDWSDYRVSLEFKIIKDTLGIIIRAVNLSNYVMLQIRQDGIKPHIRINGAWNWWEPLDVNLVFENQLSLDKWYKCQIDCTQDNIVTKLIYPDKPLFEREWKIPEGSMLFKFGTKEDQAHMIQIPFSINLEYGSIGFRNDNQEKAIIRNLLIEKI